MKAYVIVISTLAALSAIGLSWYCARVAGQITYVTLADGRRQERRIPFIFRLLLPLAPNLAPLSNSRILAPFRARAERRLTSAAFESLIRPDEFIALLALTPVIMGGVWTLFILATAALAANPMLMKADVLLCVIGVLWFLLYPELWLQRAIRERHTSIQRSLPFVMDLLTLSVEAGIDFMTALQRSLERAKVSPLTEELIRLVREIQLGKTRREALRDMSRRVNLADLRMVVNALVQADELGVSIGAILRIQADQMRTRRFERAEKLAHEAPVKMLFPLMAFIFPSVFLILLGPVIYRLVQQGF